MTRKLRVKLTNWKFGDSQTEEPAIRVTDGMYFVVMPYEHARSFADRIHDLCDQHEAQAKELDHETK